MIFPIIPPLSWRCLRRCAAKSASGADFGGTGAPFQHHENGENEQAPSFGRADEVFLYQPQHIPWQVSEMAAACVQPAHCSADVDTLLEMIVKTAQPGDFILVMSNGGFGGIHGKLLDQLAQRATRQGSAFSRQGREALCARAKKTP